MSTNESQNQHTGRRPCCLYVAMAPVILFVLLVASTIPEFFIWKQCRIPLPDGAGSVVYMTRLNKILCAEYDRKIRIETKNIHGKERLIPGDASGASPINVYWYPVRGDKGPYIRFVDPLWEYLIDLRRGKSLLMVHYRDDTYIGEVLKQYPEHSCNSIGPITDDNGEVIDPKVYVEVEVDGRPANKLDSHVASHPGAYIGCIEKYGIFTSKSAAPEVPIRPYEPSL